jgi:hypothetical protein
MKILLAITIATIFAAMPIGAADRAVRVKDWSFQREANGSVLAFTSNETGSALGVFCSQLQHCLAYLASDNGCEVGNRYVVLVSADSGALSLGTTCADIGISASKQKFVVVIDDFDTIFNTLLKAHSIGVSMPLAGGHFKVARFSLKGSNETLSAVTHALFASATAPQSAAAMDPLLAARSP